MKSRKGIFLLGTILSLLASCDSSQSERETQVEVDAALELREELNQTVWAGEVKAQRYEEVFVRLWDSIRTVSDKYEPLLNLPLSRVAFGQPASEELLDMGVLRTRYSDEADIVLDSEAARRELKKFRAEGFEIVETEWHHLEFVPGGKEAPQSVVSIAIHIRKPHATDKTEDRLILRAHLNVTWAMEEGSPTIELVQLKSFRVLKLADTQPRFVERVKISRGPHPFTTSHPLLLNDLDQDGLSEIVIPRWNSIYRNKGKGTFIPEKLVEQDIPLKESAILADLNGDSLVDLFSVSAEDGKPVLFLGKAGGEFESAKSCGSFSFDYPSCITAGDIDQDGDLDLWVAQYKMPYNDGQMPTPYYDANDGFPSVLLLNDGQGRFTDATEARGLALRRLRRTYSASFVDLDGDHDLDLMVVSDFAGVDLYENDGKGHFTDRNESWIGPRHSFGMGHVLDDFNRDGHQDFYVIGMSSTTARRLDSMKLSRDDHPDIAQMRSEMGYGNRMYLGGESPFGSPSFAKNVARTGWSWGTTSFDYDLDGDRDIYVANGHWSGESCHDYCSTYWTHDIYTGDSKDNPVVKNVFANSMLDLNLGKISWNGYEKNALLQNQDGKDFANLSFLLGAGFSYDARAAVSDDLDADGRPDLMVARMKYNSQRKFEMTYYGYQNMVPTKNNWIGLNLYESGPGLSPVGAKVKVTTSVGVQSRQVVTGDSYLSQHSNTLHFGLGPNGSVSEIEIRWPNGTLSRMEFPKANRYHTFGGKGALQAEDSSVSKAR